MTVLDRVVETSRMSAAGGDAGELFAEPVG
jgi:hypothetical protein